MKMIGWMRLRLMFFGVVVVGCAGNERHAVSANTVIELPGPRHTGTVSFEEALFGRRSIRRFGPGGVSKEQAAQLLWAAGGQSVDGVSGATRTYPSAGGIYPLEIYLVAGDIDGLRQGLYRYEWKNHALVLVKDGDVRESLNNATRGQVDPGIAACIVMTARYSRTTGRYGERGERRYVPMDMGASGQNVSLQAQALGLGTFIIGSFDDDRLRKELGFDREETALYVMPVGNR